MHCSRLTSHELDARTDTIIGFDPRLNPNGPTYVRLFYTFNGAVVDLDNASQPCGRP